METSPITSFLDQIILNDSLEDLNQLPDDSIDLGVTSPPYNKGENKKGWLVKK